MKEIGRNRDQSRPRAALVSPESQSVSFVELFFDLVFVFAVTQTVGVLHSGISMLVLGKAMLAFWLIWWAWTQFTWSLNSANTEHPRVILGILAGTAVAFAMAVEVPNAFGPDAIWFAALYVAVRATGLMIYWIVAGEQPGQRQAVRRFGLASIVGAALVIGGALVGGSGQLLLWGLAILADVAAAGIGGRHDGWAIRPGHFAERHGLIVIIALGESLIIAAGGLTGAERTTELLAIGGLAVLITCALWMTYFPRLKPSLEAALEAQSGAPRAGMARDVFSLGHFPMLCGIIAFAAAMEAMIDHPGPFPAGAQHMLLAGILLFILGAGFSKWRAGGGLPWQRLVVSGLLLTGALLAPATPIVTLTMTFLAVSIIGVLEYQSPGLEN